jgi:Kef-type K+ transport system membrane component KefB
MSCSLLFAAGGPEAERQLLLVLVQLVIILLAARVAGACFRFLGQTQVVGEIAAGLILGPSLFGRFFPETAHFIFNLEAGPVLSTLSQLGLVLLLFLIGLEFDFSHLRWNSASAVGVSLAGVILPFVLGLGLAGLIYPHIHPVDAGKPVEFVGFALFMGVAMSITAIPVLGRIMLELNIVRTKLGVVTISAAAVDDCAGWILLATVSSIVQAQFQIWLTLRMVLLTVGFVLLVLLVVRPLLITFLRRALAAGQGELSLSALAVLLATLFCCAIATSIIGIFAIFGAFMLGAALSDQEEFRTAASRQLRNFVTAFFLPIFFTYTGLRTNLGSLDTGVQWLICVAVLGCAVAGKLGGCALAARCFGMSFRDAACVGVLMNTRGLMELIVINVGSDLGVIPESLYCMLVLMALGTTIMTTPLLLWLAPGSELEPFIRQSGFLAPTGETSLAIPASPQQREVGG